MYRLNNISNMFGGRVPTGLPGKAYIEYFWEPEASTCQQYGRSVPDIIDALMPLVLITSTMAVGLYDGMASSL